MSHMWSISRQRPSGSVAFVVGVGGHGGVIIASPFGCAFRSLDHRALRGSEQSRCRTLPMTENWSLSSLITYQTSSNRIKAH